MALAISLVLAVGASAADPWTPCMKDTGGTCSNLKCYAARGDAFCNDKKQCVCNPGACAIGGVCMTKENLTQDTGTSCRVFGHDTSYMCKTNSNSNCVDGKCMCSKDEYSTMSWCVNPGVAGCAASPERLLSKGEDGICQPKCKKMTETSCMVAAITKQKLCPENSECKYAGMARWRCFCNAHACADDMSQHCDVLPGANSADLATESIEAGAESFVAIGAVVSAFALFIGVVLKKRRAIVQPAQLG